ncbi:MAG: hypothetical protein ABI164_03085, partial [Acidobacteriaceae bacterium]
MRLADIKQEESAMKPTEAASHTEGRASTAGTRPIGEKFRTVRQVPLSNVSPALVTLVPEGVELNPKQLVMAEQFRLLRTRVKALSKDFQLRTMLITSALPGEGKTTVSANLAVSLSRVEGLRVL